MADADILGSERLIAQSELVIGGQKSGKSRRAEGLASSWLAQSPQHQAVLIATAQPYDDEMAARIARHQSDRAERVPALRCVEEPLALAEAITRHSQLGTLVVVDCLTLWLTNQLMPAAPPADGADGSGELASNHGFDGFSPSNRPLVTESIDVIAMLLIAIRNAPGPVVLVGNEIGLGVIPMGRETRAFVDALGRLNQAVAAACERVTFMAAGLPLMLKGTE